MHIVGAEPQWNFSVPVQVYPFFCQLSQAMLGMNIWLILHHLHPFSSTTLLTAVLTDHVQLPNPVLEGIGRFWMSCTMVRVMMGFKKVEKEEKTRVRKYEANELIQFIHRIRYNSLRYDE